MRHSGAKQQEAPMTVEAYLEYEMTAPSRHEYINGQLFEMAGEKDINNEIALTLGFLLRAQLSSMGFEVYMHSVKVGIPSGEKFFIRMYL